MSKPTATVSANSIVLVMDGQTHTVQKDAPNFSALREALLDRNWAAVPSLLLASKAVEAWADGEFSITDNKVTHKGEPLPAGLAKRILEMVAQSKPFKPVLRFWQRVCRNPDPNSVDQLWSFLQHTGLPLTADGCFLAYKGVNKDGTDCTTGKFKNVPGASFEMPRPEVDSDPKSACGRGFHVGALNYARSFGPRVVICKVDPEYVVSVPADCSCMKMRVCQYEVVGNFGDRLDDLLEEKLPDVAQLPTVVDVLGQKPRVKEGAPAEKPRVKDGRASTWAETMPVFDESTWEKFDRMDAATLMAQGIEVLRRYAAMHLKVVGAYKMAGGKTALLAAIMALRS